MNGGGGGRYFSKNSSYYLHGKSQHSLDESLPLLKSWEDNWNANYLEEKKEEEGVEFFQENDNKTLYNIQKPVELTMK